MAKRGRPSKRPVDPMDTGERIPGATETKSAPADTVGDYIYRSKNPFTIGLQIPTEVSVRQPGDTYVERTVQKRIRVKFDDSLHTLIINESMAESLGVSIVSLNKALRAWPSYGLEFVQVGGPGFKPSATILAFDAACQKTVAMKKGKNIIQGAKSSSNVT